MRLHCKSKYYRANFAGTIDSKTPFSLLHFPTNWKCPVRILLSSRLSLDNVNGVCTSFFKTINFLQWHIHPFTSFKRIIMQNCLFCPVSKCYLSILYDFFFETIKGTRWYTINCIFICKYNDSPSDKIVHLKKIRKQDKFGNVWNMSVLFVVNTK